VYFQKEPLVVRLSRLAETGRTGVLRVSGEHGGAIHLSEGEIVYAESRRTPDPSRWFARLSGLGAGLAADLGTGSAADLGADATPAPEHPDAGGLARAFALREATLDAALELLSAPPRYALRQRFRESEPPMMDTPGGMPLAELLAEVTRRQELVKQMAESAVPLTADTPLVRVPDIDSPRLQVSALQWALLIRVHGHATPRELAWEIGNSVFGTTLEVFRLIALGFLTVAGRPAPSQASPPREPGGGGAGFGGRPMVSFLRAVTG